MPSLFKRSNGFYYICYEEDGKRKWKSTGKTLKADAYKEMMQFQNHLKTHPTKTTLREFIDEFHSHTESMYAPKTRELYSHALSLLLSQVGNKYLSAVSPKDADQYRSVRSKAVSPTSVNMELRALKACFSHAVRWRLLSENPFSGVSFVRIPECSGSEDGAPIGAGN